MIDFLFTIIKLPFLIVSGVAGVLITPELFEELRQKLIGFSFGDFFSAIGNFFKQVFEKISDISWRDLFGSITAAKAGYFIGGLIEFIAEIVAGALLSGCIVSVASLGRKFFEGTEKLLASIVEMVKISFNQKSQNLFSPNNLDMTFHKVNPLNFKIFAPRFTNDDTRNIRQKRHRS